MRELKDRVGLGWRPELAAGILGSLDRIDVVEVIADDLFCASKARLRAVRTLAAQVPVTLHGVSMGLASTVAVAPARLDAMAKVIDAVRPEGWSEHLAFVRGGGVEIGHLAMPPRCSETIAGLCANVARATRVTGARPLLENVASLIEPPGSRLGEGAFLQDVVAATGAQLLLDLHNLHANAFNFGFDALDVLRSLPVDRIGAVHLAGGRMIPATSRPRLLDDHLHDVPAPVFALLERLAARVDRPLTVILERDGRYPSMESMLAELDEARASIARGRAQRAKEAA